jgi:outer membrane receptor protein involved in Fe transport
VNERGQASIELVAVLPLAIAAVLGVVQVLAAGAASESAAAAAEAGAVAILQDADPAVAARRALGRSATTRATIAVQDRRVTVRVRPAALARPLADLLEQTAVADAGPGLAATPSTTVVRGGDGDGSRPSGDR